MEEESVEEEEERKERYEGTPCPRRAVLEFTIAAVPIRICRIQGLTQDSFRGVTFTDVEEMELRTRPRRS